MRSAVDEQGCQAVTKHRVSVVDSELGEGQLPVPIIFSTVGEGAESIADDTIGSLYVWYAEPTMRHELMPLANARNTSLVNLGS
jgi:hypothetical protein